MNILATTLVQPVVNLDITTVLMLCNTFITFMIVKHFLYEPVNKMLKARQDEVSKIYSDAETANKSAMDMKAEYEKQLATARDQATDIVKSAELRAQSLADERLSEAQAKVRSIIDRANAQVDADKARAIKEVKDEMADLAIAAAQRIINKNLDKEAQEQLVEDFINSVDTL